MNPLMLDSDDYIPELRHSCNECLFFKFTKSGKMSCKNDKTKVLSRVFYKNTCTSYIPRGDVPIKNAKKKGIRK